MAYMMKVCGLKEQNSAGQPDNPYRYLTGWIDTNTKLVVMPNRDRSADPDADWIVYIASYRDKEVKAPGDDTQSMDTL